MKRTAEYWISRLQLIKHIEGGWYRETYRSASNFPIFPANPDFPSARSFSTAIYFLLQGSEFSAFHRIASDEIWHFYDGDPLQILEIETDGRITEHRLGNDPDSSFSFQAIIRSGNWFASRLAAGGQYALAGCTVAPGFDFSDFELAERSALLLSYPQHSGLIQSLTR